MESYFIKQDHSNCKVMFGIVFFLAFAIVMHIFVVDRTVYLSGVISLLIMLVIYVFFANYFDSFGIYCEKDEMYFKRFKKKFIDPNTIVGIKIVKSEYHGNFGLTYLRDIRGNYLYSMIFLKEIKHGMWDYKHGDVMFLHEYRDCSICKSIYDEEFIRYLKTKNDKIEIL